MIEHFVQFYEDDAYLVNQVAAFIRSGLRAGDAAIVIGTKPHRDDLEKRLKADVARAAAQRPAGEYYVALDSADMLSQFMVDGRLDEARFTGLMVPILKRATDSGNGRVRVFGEMVGMLCMEGRHDTAVRLEEFWNDLAGIHSFSLFCAYPMRAFPKAADGAPFLRICDEHARVSPAESYKPPANAHEHFRTIAVLQQKAVALENQMADRKSVDPLS
jgi:hypothetical protein